MKPQLLTRFGRLAVAHRRLLATLAAMVAALSLGMIASGQGQTSQPVVSIVNTVAAGQTLTAADLTLTEVPTALVPEDALTDPAAAIGRMPAVALTRGSLLTPGLLIDIGGRGTAEGRLIMPIRLNQRELVSLITAGDRIALLITDASGQTTVAEDVRVVAVPQTSDGGMWSSSEPDYVLVDVPVETATQLAGAGVASVTIALR